jgi:phage head maturation protease
MQYFVVMIDYGRRGREAIVDPEITRREVISRVASGEYKNISFIHEIADSAVDDITAEILAEAALPEIAPIESPCTGADLQASRFDHARDLRKHEAV